QHVGRVLDKARRDLPELLSDTRRPLLLRRLVERKLRHRGRWELIGPDVAGPEDVSRRWDRIHRVRPAGVEGQVRDDLGYLRRLHAAVESEAEVVRQLHCLMAGDESRDRHDAAVARREAWPFPEIVLENLLRVALERGRDGADVFRL